jgi:hypothetical protein
MLPRTVLATLACAVFMLQVGVARATPDFPGAVVSDLMLPGITIDAPMGCTLCHTSDLGGTTLKPFGTLLQADGLAPYNLTSLHDALAQIATEQPKLIADIKAGIDPSPDVAGIVAPEYGCSLTRAGAPPSWIVAGALAGTALVFAGRRRRPQRV